MDENLLILLTSVASNAIFYVLFREQLVKADKRQIDADLRWQDVVNDARKERDRLLEIIMSNAKEATKSRKTSNEQQRLEEASGRVKPPSEPIPPPGERRLPIEY